MPASRGDRLDSWKEIAAYLNRGVRTVRRWEHEEGLPVHRHQHRVLGSVYAYKSEIDAWRSTSRRAPAAIQRAAAASRGEALRQAGQGLDDRRVRPDRVARVIVDALAVRLTSDERRQLAERAVDHVHAYECYVHARQEAWRWRKDAIDHAVRTLRNGLTIVGDNAQLYAALGLAHLQYREAGIDLGERPLREAERCATQLFAIDPASAAGLQLRGWIEYSRGRIQEAVRDLKAALYVDPADADTLLMLSNCYLISGKVQDARPIIERLLAVDRVTPLTRCMPAFADLLEGHFAAAVGPYRAMFDMDPGNPMARLFYAWVLLLNGHSDSATDIVQRFPPELHATVPARIARFLAASVTHRPDEAFEGVTAEVAAAAEATDVFARMLAQGYAVSGRPEEATRWLAVAVERGFINYPFMAQHDPFLAAIRGHGPFVRLMDTVRDRWRRFEP